MQPGSCMPEHERDTQKKKQSERQRPGAVLAAPAAVADKSTARRTLLLTSLGGDNLKSPLAIPSSIWLMLHPSATSE